MSCSRCGQSNRPRPVTPPSVVGRPGTVYYPGKPVGTPPTQSPIPASTIQGAINGLRYVPPSK